MSYTKNILGDIIQEKSICLHNLPTGYPESRLVEEVDKELKATSIYCLKNKMYICFNEGDLSTPLFSDGDTIYETSVGQIKITASEMSNSEYIEICDLEKNKQEWEILDDPTSKNDPQSPKKVDSEFEVVDSNCFKIKIRHYGQQYDPRLNEAYGRTD